MLDARNLGKDTRNLVKKLSDHATEGFSTLKAPVVAGVKRAAPVYRKISDSTVEWFDKTMDALATSPDSPPTAGRKLLQFGADLVPGGPAVRTFADARALYATGKPEQMQDARRLCIRSALELAVDGAFIGLLALKEARILVTAARYGREAKKRLSAHPSTDILDHAAAKLAKDPRICHAADRALRKARDNDDKGGQQEPPPAGPGGSTDYCI